MTKGARRDLPVAVVGAGLAGLTAAALLRRRGIPIVVFEASDRIAGLAQSHADDDGFRYDVGAHFITNRLAAAIGVGAQCHVAARYGETVVVAHRYYTYPFGMLRERRYLAGAIGARLAPKRRTPSDASGWFEARYGTAFAREIAVPLIEAWSGVPGNELAASVADSIPGSVVHTLFLTFAGRVTHRPVAVGYSRSVRESPHVWHVFPDGGVATLCGRLASEVHDAVQLLSPVERITVSHGRAVSIRAGGTDVDVAGVVSTAPVHVLAKLVSGTDALVPLMRFRYRPMIFANLRFAGRGLLPDVVVWTPEKRYPFFRLTETPLAMPSAAPPGMTLITADIGCETTDATWGLDDESIGKLCLEGIAPIIPDAASRYLGCRVLRTTIAYPVFRLEYEAFRRSFAGRTGIDGLISVGRNGEFDHIFMEDVYWRTAAKVRLLAAQLEGTEKTPPERGSDGSANGS